MLLAGRDRCSEQNRAVTGSYLWAVTFSSVLAACGFASTTLGQLGVSTAGNRAEKKIVNKGSVTLKDLDPRVAVHCGIPSTASILAFDPIQRLLAIGTLDGRIKVIGGDNIEGLLFSGKPVPFKYLKFLENQGFLVSVSNENEVQVWDLEHRCIVSNLQWESNITAFSVIYGTNYMYVGDEFGFLSILKYVAEKGELLQLPYHIPANLISDARSSSPIKREREVVKFFPTLQNENRVRVLKKELCNKSPFATGTVSAKAAPPS
ncbi:hypothetical protein RHMOL_Rhmol03G0167000 [Rhododendron molle]|uniref:Uncharacterized protein n=1 Tax=Rhododendron molle TaxID=49168 RepID=A0ACC0PGH0_RHOML|nr:hypothetical protein RHMOL_Rhmol03G0167000 [Rhododendron molle]